ncbi:MAG: hypothetical protein AB1861_23420 [Cyanobacteriota bacterium]
MKKWQSLARTSFGYFRKQHDRRLCVPFTDLPQPGLTRLGADALL